MYAPSVRGEILVIKRRQLNCYRAFLLILSISLAVWGCSRAPAGGPTQTSAERPNILLILIDDLGHEALGAYGGVSYDTPNLDALAQSGVRFNHAYSTPLCSTSRVQLMTGVYNNRNYTQWGILPPDAITFGHLLRDAGYATFVAGKWQLWGHELLWPVEEPCCLHEGQTPTDAGFDDYLVWYLGNKGNRYADPLLSIRPEDDSVYDGKYGPDLLTDFVIGSIETQVRERPEQPFFGYYSMVLTHDPFEPTPDSPGWSGDRHARDRANFPDMVEYVDKVIGRILNKLEALGIRDDTLVLLSADNGTPRGIESRMADGRTIIGDKARPTDGGTHVPFIASWPGTIPRLVVSDALIDLTDFLPSLVEVAGAELPVDMLIDGRSFLPILRGEADSIRDWVFTDFRPRFPGIGDATYARDQRFKLYDDGRFFDITNDVLEEHSLALKGMSTEAIAARSALQVVLDQMRSTTPDDDR